jgi:drug/metabolite transporter (DMT)-like permease
MPAALALLAALLFGLALITTQFAVRHMDGLAGAKVSITSSAIFWWLLVPFKGLEGGNAMGAAIFAAAGLFFPVSVTLLAYAANRRLGPTIAGAIGSTAPLFAVLGAVVFLGERLGFAQITAILAIVVGSIVLSLRHGGEVKLTGAWISWCAAALRAIAQVVVKAGFAVWANPYAAIVLGYTVSTVVIWLVGAASKRPESRIYNRRGVLWFWLTGFINSCALFVLYAALEAGTVSVVSPIAASYPLITLALNTLVLREERLTLRLALGVALMVSGVVALLLP